MMDEGEEPSSEVVAKYVSDLIKESVENAITTIMKNEEVKWKIVRKTDIGLGHEKSNKIRKESTQR